ncbi:alpha/beta fold hydrolase [Limobrevibacterium gyesilva]|uniref:Alpha/beta hydrolase n=1 Tax=Limobrevibacterium gyesilva TaxID=2991712 RepID=A0AA41YMJ1_9PROT|nr:alpha/beta hydrolase [Limobrevibacterium gyesilva]MCW3476646.1 alpha/beta hydrolase [Limobrevibacterium gyesilva]
MITLDGKRIETAWWGPGPDVAPTLVLLHEGLGCVALWRGFPEKLAAATGFGVFAYSRLGYGTSDPVPLPRPVSYMHDEARDMLGRVLDAAGIRRCILVGHSDGASIAALYAGGVQDFRVRGLALLSPHYFVEAICLDAIAQARTAYETGDLRARLARYHDNVDVAFRGWNGAWLDPAFRAWDITDALAHIRVPVLQLQGLDDPYGTVAQPHIAEEVAYCPVETVLLDAKHAPQFEAPTESLSAITDFAHRIFRVHEP